MNRKVFFDHVRDLMFGGGLSQEQVEGCEAILDAVQGWDLRWQAYALATAYGETARTMQPIAEYGKGRGRKYGKPGKHNGQVAYGRGYVQLTWDWNYANADMKLGLNGALINDYELALDPKIAAQIMTRGMSEGWFTGKKLGDYFNDKRTDWKNARRIINGTDHWKTYANWAVIFHRALEAADDGTVAKQNPEPLGKTEQPTNWLAALINAILSIFRRKS